MSLIDIQPVLDSAAGVLDTCACGDRGAFRRAAGLEGPDPEATAHAVMLRHMLDLQPCDPAARQNTVQTLNGLLGGKDGLAGESLSVTAGVFSALRCLDAEIPRAPGVLDSIRDKDLLPVYLERQDWSRKPVKAAREAASLYSTLVLSNAVGPEWEDTWFLWFSRYSDEHTGLFHRGPVTPVDLEGQWTLWPYLAGHAQILASHWYAHRAHPHSWRLIDTLLDMLEINWTLFCRDVSGRELPLMLGMVRSMRLSPHRHEECGQALRRLGHRWVRFLREQANSGALTDLCATTRIVCALSELQAALPGFLRSRHPLRSLLSRVPQIP